MEDHQRIQVEDKALEASWKNALKEEFTKAYFKEIKQFLTKEIQTGKTIYPKGSHIFKALNLCPFNQVKAVILGQDPYHQPSQAMGLSFSVPKNVRIPPSLRNIYKELHDDLGISPAKHGDLTAWAKQDVLLINAILTVEHAQAGSHRKIGWQNFTDRIIQKLSEERNSIVFMLWGNFARSKKKLIDQDRHLVLEAPHPSPLARGGFFGCKHFSACNSYLEEKGITPINWKIDDK